MDLRDLDRHLVARLGLSLSREELHAVFTWLDKDSTGLVAGVDGPCDSCSPEETGGVILGKLGVHGGELSSSHGCGTTWW